MATPSVRVADQGTNYITFLFYNLYLTVVDFNDNQYNVQNKKLSVWQDGVLIFDETPFRVTSDTKQFGVSNLEAGTDYIFEFLITYSINGEDYVELNEQIEVGTLDIINTPSYEVSVLDNDVTISVNNLSNNVYVNYYIYDEYKSSIVNYQQDSLQNYKIFSNLPNGNYYAKVTYYSGYNIPEIMFQRYTQEEWTSISINVTPPTPQGDWALDDSNSITINTSTSVPYLFNLSRHYLYRWTIYFSFSETTEVNFYSTGNASLYAWLSSSSQTSWDNYNGVPNNYLTYDTQGGNYMMSYSCAPGTYYLWIRTASGEAYTGQDCTFYFDLSGSGSETRWHYDCDSVTHSISASYGYSTGLTLSAGNGYVIPVTFSHSGCSIFYSTSPSSSLDTIAYLTTSFSNQSYFDTTGEVYNPLALDDNSGENNNFEFAYPVQVYQAQSNGPVYYLWIRFKNIQDSGSIQVSINRPVYYTASVISGSNSIRFDVYNKPNDYYLKYFVRIASDVNDITYETTPPYAANTQLTVTSSYLQYGQSYMVDVGITKIQNGGGNITRIGAIGPLTISQGGYVYIYTGSQTGWKRAIPYIYTGSQIGWKRAIPYIYDGSNWKQCGG